MNSRNSTLSTHSYLLVLLLAPLVFHKFLPNIHTVLLFVSQGLTKTISVPLDFELPSRTEGIHQWVQWDSIHPYSHNLLFLIDLAVIGTVPVSSFPISS